MRSVLRLLPAHAARVSRAVALGHPWIYDRAVGATPLPPGAIVEVRGDAPLGCGFVDPASPIRVRMLARDPGQAIEADAEIVALSRKGATARIDATRPASRRPTRRVTLR